MHKLNHIQFPTVYSYSFDENNALEALKDNAQFDALSASFLSNTPFSKLNTFSFSPDGFVAMMMSFEGKIAVSLGESEAIVQAAKLCEQYGKDITFLSLNHDGTVNLDILDDSFTVVFISSYVMDTFVKTNLKSVKEKTKALLIGNVSASLQDMKLLNVALFDAYKLTGFQTHSVALHNGVLAEQFLSQYDVIGLSMMKNVLDKSTNTITIKNSFIEVLKQTLDEDILFFVDNEKTLAHTLHFGLKNIKAREIIRTLALSSIFITNGEGCSLGLSRPSRIIQSMGYSELESRQAISLSFDTNLTLEQMQHIASVIAKKYRQIRRLNA